MNLAFYKRLAAFKGDFEGSFTPDERHSIIQSISVLDELLPQMNEKDVKFLLGSATSDSGLTNGNIANAITKHASHTGNMELLQAIPETIPSDPVMTKGYYENALKHNHLDIARALEKRLGKEISLEKNFLTLLERPSLDVVKYLHEEKQLPLELPDGQYGEAYSTLRASAKRDNPEVYDYCIQNGSNPDVIRFGRTIFEEACYEGSLQIVQKIMASREVPERELLTGCVVAVIGKHQETFSVISEKAGIAKEGDRRFAAAFKEAVEAEGFPIETLGQEIARNGGIEILPALKAAGLYEQIVPEHVRLDEQNMKKGEFWDKYGKGNARWVELTGESAPRGLTDISPYGFKNKVYNDLQGTLRFASADEASAFGTGYAREAGKLTVLFGNVDAAEQYLKKFTAAHPDSRQPVHDACLFELPTKGKWNVEAWRALVHKFGAPALEYLANAPAYERELGHPPKNLKELEPYKNSPLYENKDKDMELARLCTTHGITEAGFERGLTALAHAKQADHIPDIGVIRGESLDNSQLDHSRYYMMKLAPNDKRALVMGKIVDCCNHLDGQTFMMAEAAITSPDCGVYAIFRRAKLTDAPNPKEDPIIAKTSVWMSKDNNVVFNSWERKSGYSEIGEQFLDKAAERILEDNKSITRVVLGRNRDDFEKFALLGEDTEAYATKCKAAGLETPVLEKPRDVNARSGDSLAQYLVLDQSGLRRREQAQQIGLSSQATSEVNLVMNGLRTQLTAAITTAMPAVSKNRYLS